MVLDVSWDAQEPVQSVDVARAVVERRGGPWAIPCVVLRPIENMPKGALRREGVPTQRVTNGIGTVRWAVAGRRWP